MNTWERDKLLMELPEFSFKPLQAKRKKAMGEEFQKYQSFYGLDFTNDLKNLKQSIGWFDAIGYRIVMQCYVPDQAKATIFLFHGYFDHIGLYKHLIQFLIKHHYAVVAYDMPGHGLSSGTPTSISTFKEYQGVINECIKLCEDNLPKPFHCIGQSTGGAVLIDHLANSNASIFEKTVLLAPLVRPKDWHIAKGIHSVVKPFLRVWYRSFADNSNDAEFVSFIKKKDPLQSKWMAIDWISSLREWIPKIESSPALKRKVLIIQGTHDETVDWRHNVEVLKSLFTEVKIAYIDKGRHHLVNESQDKREQVFQAILSEL